MAGSGVWQFFVLKGLSVSGLWGFRVPALFLGWREGFTGRLGLVYEMTAEGSTSLGLPDW